ncbi:hypothetical protein BAE44_0019846 [Dichanthelium oligosanthes]|uniref:Uncharacterized protein n=1 Tax=Dichanthelium oligosanthes TaxID=888268 RepID=A0A1E5V260_9POAL|nr:hypothetical protein BAE44_0019846 [Dichanthelium oligosanthes]
MSSMEAGERMKDKNQVEHIRSTLKQAVPLTRVHSQQFHDGNSDTKQIKIEIMDHDQLVEELKNHLAGKRYLLLIDDIWSAKTWDSIRLCFPTENNKGSRIIVTTRFQDVGATCSQGDRIDLLHTIDFLNAGDSKTLFDQSVSESRSSRLSEKKQHQVPEEIWKICGGLPLAIVTIAILSPAIQTGVKKRLTRRWIAEGFVSEKQGLTEKEVAETYFNQLMRRNIIRPVEHSSNGKVKTFQVHDMVLEYIVSKSSQENFITVVGGHRMMPAPSNKVRRLSMQSSGSNNANSTKGISLSQVRSLTVFGSLNEIPFDSFNNGIIQVLDLEGWKGLKVKHLHDTCKMLVLKYLSLRRTEIAKILSDIEKVKYLETLDIRETDVGELPKSVGQLKRISGILGRTKSRRRGSRLPDEKIKDPRKNMLPQEKSKDAMKALRCCQGLRLLGNQQLSQAFIS